jgi:hypothetical protein
MRRWDRLLDSYLEEYRARGVSSQSVAYTESRLNLPLDSGIDREISKERFWAEPELMQLPCSQRA